MNTSIDTREATFNTICTSKEHTTLQSIKTIGAALSLSVALAIGTPGCKTDSTKLAEKTEITDEVEKPVVYNRLKPEALFFTAMIQHSNKDVDSEFGLLIREVAKKDPVYVLQKIEEYSEEFKERQDLFLFTIDQVLGAYTFFQLPDKEEYLGSLDIVNRAITNMRQKWGSEAVITLEIATTKLHLSLLENCQGFLSRSEWKYTEKTIPHFKNPVLRDGLRLCLINNIAARKEHILYSYIFITHDVIPETAGEVARELIFNDDDLKTTFDLIDQLETKDKKNKDQEVERVIFNLARDVGDDFLEPQERAKLMKDILAVLAKYPHYNNLITPLKETYVIASEMDNPSISDEEKAKIWEQVKAKLNKMYQYSYNTDGEVYFY